MYGETVLPLRSLPSRRWIFSCSHPPEARGPSGAFVYPLRLSRRQRTRLTFDPFFFLPSATKPSSRPSEHSSTSITHSSRSKTLCSVFWETLLPLEESESECNGVDFEGTLLLIRSSSRTFFLASLEDLIVFRLVQQMVSRDYIPFKVSESSFSHHVVVVLS